MKAIERIEERYLTSDLAVSPGGWCCHCWCHCIAAGMAQEEEEL